ASPLPMGERSARVSAPGEGDRANESHMPPHPNPLPQGEREHAVRAPLTGSETPRDGRDYSAAVFAGFLIAALTRGITSSAISCMERLASAGSTQSMPA